MIPQRLFTLCNYRFQITSQKPSPNSDNNSGNVCVCVCVHKPTYLYQKVAEGVSSNLPWNWICFKIMWRKTYTDETKSGLRAGRCYGQVRSSRGCFLLYSLIFYGVSPMAQWEKNPPEKESTCNIGDIGDAGLIPGPGKIPWRKRRQPTPIFAPEKSHVQRSLAGYL